MTMQDISFWVQIALQVVIGGSILAGVSRYFSILRRAIDSQKATIDAQAEQIKGQSTVLQDFERLNTLMKQVIDTVSDPEALKREEAYRARVDRDANALLDKTAGGFTALIGRAMPYIPAAVMVRLIEAADLSPEYKETLKGLATAAPDSLRYEVTRVASFQQDYFRRLTPRLRAYQTNLSLDDLDGEPPTP